MESFELDDLRHNARRTFVQAASGVFRGRNRAVWIVCAIVSLLSTRTLLVELNVHFPLHLHFVHLATASTIVVASYIRSAKKLQAYPSPPTSAGWIALMFTACLMALSIDSTLQAVLHFQNLPTLVMLSAASFLAEAVLLLLLGRNPYSKSQVLQIALLTFACGGVLAGEYRLLVQALNASIPAALAAGFARALYYSAAAWHSDINSMNALLCCAGLLITGLWNSYGTDESLQKFLHALHWKYIPLLLVNALSSAVAILKGKSIIFPMDNIQGKSDGCKDESLRDAVTLFVFTAITGCASSLMLRRSYASWLQLASLLLAVACIGGSSAYATLRFRDEEHQTAYTRLGVSSELPSAHRDDTAVSGGAGNESVPIVREHGRISVASMGSVSIVLIALWTVFSILNFSERLYVEVREVAPILNLEYKPQVPAEIVISMYKEPIEEVAQLISTLRDMPSLSSAQVHIYVKDEKREIDDIQLRTKADNVSSLPNVGREGETYLNHILTHWDDLAEHTIFLQADVHNPREFYPRVRKYYDPERTGMLSLGWSGQVCNCEECGDRWTFWDVTHLFPHIHDRINNSTSCDKVLLSYKGQFIVSAKRIRGVEKSVYHDLWEAFVDPNSYVHQEEYLKGRPDSLSQPIFGYEIERIWNLLFQCSSMDVAWKCPTLLSGTRLGGSIEDCQCFDPIRGVR